MAALPDLVAYTDDVVNNIIGSGESREEIAEKKAEEEEAHKIAVEKRKVEEKKKKE